MTRKKTLICIIISLMTVLGVVFSIGIYNQLSNYSKVDKFCCENYKDYIAKFSSEKILGTVENAQEAKKNAEEIWIELYGKDVKEMKPYRVFFDEENQVWMVRGELPRNCVGGVPHILIEKESGKVLAVWHDK